MNIIFYVKVVVSIAMVLFAICLTAWFAYDVKKQKILLKGLKYRREYGLFELKQYVSGEKEPVVSCKQENNGIAPKDFKANLKCVNYFPFILEDEQRGE